jgi:hypothetical protein
MMVGKAGTSYKYDELDRVISTTRSKGNETFTGRYTYDIRGRMNRYTYPNAFAINYTYTHNDDLKEIRDSTTNQLVWEVVDVNPKGQFSHVMDGNKKLTTYGYDTNDRLIA